MSTRSSESFEPLLGSTEKDNEHFNIPGLTPSSRLSLATNILIGIITISTLTTTIFTVLVGTAVLHPSKALPAITQPQYSPWRSCGSTPATARSRDCTFDIISFTWLTPECYDASLTTEFTNWQDWTWYADEFSNTTIPGDMAILGEQDAWVDWHYHVVHCTFMWRQMHRAIERGWIGDHLNVYEHTKHCQHTFLQNATVNANVRTPAIVFYPECLRVGAGHGMYPGPQYGT